MRYGRLFRPGTDVGGGYPLIPARAGQNAYRRAMDSDLLYAEGYARRPPGITTYSAWCLDGETVVSRSCPWAQMLGWTATAPGQLDLLAGLLDGIEVIEGLAIDTELRWSLLQRLAAMGRAGDAEIDAEVARDHTNAGQRHAAGCRASVPDAEHKAGAWQALTEPGGLGIEEAVEIGFGFNQAEHAGLLAGFTGRYFAELPDVWIRYGGMLRMVLGGLLFPYSAASPG